jgi:fructokinase
LQIGIEEDAEANSKRKLPVVRIAFQFTAQAGSDRAQDHSQPKTATVTGAEDGNFKISGVTVPRGKSMNDSALMVGLGEVLWDLLPAGKVLGGAPANFAYMAKLLGNRGIVASSIGDDTLGREAHQVLRGLNLGTEYLQHDDQHATGTAQVSIAADGQPTFTIRESVAWDFLLWTEAWQELSARTDVVCFGSLAQRSPVSANTINQFLQNASGNALRVFDVNLRQSYYGADVLDRSLKHADLVKLNDQELPLVAEPLGLAAGNEKELARRLLDKYCLKLVCVTRGAKGSLLISKDQEAEHEGFRVKVADSVGAGDAFTACMAHHFLRGKSLKEISESANRFAAWVASQVGATPKFNDTLLREEMTFEDTPN